MNAFSRLRLPGGSFALLLIGLAFTGCTDKDPYSDATSPNGVYMEYMGDDELEQLQAAEPFLLAMGKREYGKAYDLLSSWAKKDLVEGQFQFPTETEASRRKPIPELSKEMFVDYMQRFEQEAVVPVKASEMFVYSMDKEDLSGGRKEIDNFFVVSIPESVPIEIRTSVIEAYITCKHSPESLAEMMKEYEISKTQAESEDYAPIIGMEIFMVNEDGQIKVGYFDIYREE